MDKEVTEKKKLQRNKRVNHTSYPRATQSAAKQLASHFQQFSH
jgi:hypothetical protein